MKMSKVLRRTAIACTVATIIGGASYSTGFAKTDSSQKIQHGQLLLKGEILPTGMRITPTAAKGAQFDFLHPQLIDYPDFVADHAVDIATSPDGKTLLVLTSGYNRNYDANAHRGGNEFVFVYDVTAGHPVKKQVLQVPNTYNGIAWNPNGQEFYVSGGVNDNVHIFNKAGDTWQEAGAAVELGHMNKGEGIRVRPMAAGMAVNKSGTRLLVANFENDSVSLIDLQTRLEIAELDLRPGKIDPAMSGKPGGTYPVSVSFVGDDKAYVSAQRDRELIALSTEDDNLAVVSRIGFKGQPTKMTLNKAQDHLYVVSDNSDSIVVLDTRKNEILEEIPVIAPKSVFPNPDELKGANPTNVSLSPDEGTLFVTNGGTNSVAVIQLAHAMLDNDDDDDEQEHEKHHGKSRVIGLIPTGWYPNAVSVSQDGAMLYVVNGKDNAGPNPQGCRDTVSIASGSLNPCRAANQYVWQLEKAGFLSMPMPKARELARLTWQVAKNNNFSSMKQHKRWKQTMNFMRDKIEHVIYIVKENRTYDQVLGALEVGNGDPSLAILAPYSPNHIQMAKQFVVMDNFYDSGETSNTGWNWTTSARSTDFTEKTSPVNYAGRGLTYDWEGSNRNVPVSLTYAERAALGLPVDADILAGHADVAAPDSPQGEAGAGYLWDAALRAGLSVRNYGFYVANLQSVSSMSREALITPFAAGTPHVIPLKRALNDVTDTFFRGYDQSYPDFWRFKEWEREFDMYAAKGKLPNLNLLRIPHDHFGSYGSAIDGVNTVETEMADNDYTIGLIAEKVANSPFKDNTLIVVVEDDAQNGGDHVDPHRSIAFIVGPYVKQGGEVISKHYTTVSLLRTIEEVLDIEPMGINDGLATPMYEVFDVEQRDWNYQAAVPEILYSTDLPLPDAATALVAKSETHCDRQPLRTAAYWQQAMAGQDFSVEDKLDTDRFNQALWTGLKGEKAAYPAVRHGRDMRQNREKLLAQYRAKRQQACKVKLSQR